MLVARTPRGTVTGASAARRFHLASRSAQAAQEIKALIEESGRRVEDGSKLVEQAGETMAGVVGAVRRVSEIIDEISTAAQEQSQGIAQVNAAVVQMDRITQQNAALVQEAAAASASLAEQAQTLQKAVAVFRVSDGPGQVQACLRACSQALPRPLRAITPMPSSAPRSGA